MKKILGLDLGTNSIGWALIEEENNLLQKILDCGCRIIAEKDEHCDFEAGFNIQKEQLESKSFLHCHSRESGNLGFTPA